MKKLSKRILSAFLAIIMLASVLPTGMITAQAAGYKYDPDAAIAFAKSHCSNDGSSCKKRWLCAEFVANCLLAGGFPKKLSAVAGLSGFGGQIKKYGTINPSTTTGIGVKVYASSFKYKLKKGDPIVILYSKKSGSGNGHVVIYSGENTKNGILKVYAHNRIKRNEPLYAGYKGHKAVEIYAVSMNNTTPSYGFYSNRATNETNSSAYISAYSNIKADVSKYGYAISCDDDDRHGNEIERLDLTSNTTKTHDDSYLQKNYCRSMDWRKLEDYGNSTRSMQNFGTTVSGLKPNKRYYVKWAVKVGNKWYQTGVRCIDTKSTKPSATTLKMSDSYKNIGIEDTATLYWSSASGASSYTLVLKNSSSAEICRISSIKGTTCTIDSKYFKASGEYTAYLYANNSAGSTLCNGNPQITVKPNVTVTYYDTVTNKNIFVDSVRYGHDSVLPENPSQEGYTFQNWDSSNKKVTANKTIKTVYKKNTYTVSFVDSLTGAILKTQKVEYLDSATAPSVKNDADGYVFKGWDRDFSSIKEDTTVTSNYEWYDTDFPVSTSLVSADRNTEKNGYYVTIKVNNGTDDIVKGRLVVALKTQTGELLTTTESAAFSLGSKNSETASKTVNVFAPSDDYAYEIVAYTVNDYDKAGPIAKPVNIAPNNNAWSGWIEYSGDIPVTNGENGVTGVETKTVPMYRYRTKSTTTSYEPSISGWTQSGSRWISQGQQSMEYIPSFHSGFDKSNWYYTHYNKSAKSNYETNTEKLVVNSNNSTRYVYWHWCEGKSASSPGNHYIAWNKSSKYKKFHAFSSGTRKSYEGTAYNAYKFSNKDECSYNYNWNGLTSKKDSLTTIYNQKYTIYKKQFDYYKYSNWSDWSTTSKAASSTVQVENKNVNYYRYKSDKPAQPNVEATQKVNLTGTVRKDYAGKNVDVYVFKHTQTSDYTNEYIGNTTVGTQGEISIKNAILRESPTPETGDYTVVAAVAGTTTAIKIGTIEAPKRTFKVRYFDYDGKTVISEQTVKEGETVTAPSKTLLTVPTGFRFDGWSESTVNVRSNIDVMPLCEAETYVVTFVDWTSQKVKMENYNYGDVISLPSIDFDQEGKDISWDVSGLTKTEIVLEDGTKSTQYVVTQNTVVTTKIETEKISSTFVDNKNLLDKMDENGTLNNDNIDYGSLDVIKADENNFGDVISTPTDLEESEDYIFYGWKSITTGEYLTDNKAVQSDVYYPVYDFADTTEIPQANIPSGEYTSNQTVELSCPTENATIYYTTDGTDPKTSKTAIEYTAPISLNKSCVLKFYSMALGMNDSEVIVENYAINTATSGTKYHIVNISANIEEYDGSVYQILLKENKTIDFSQYKDIYGYTFDGLYYDSKHTDQFFEDELITESLTLYANYIAKKYTATFVDSDKKTVLGTSTVDYLSSAAEPQVTAPDGYVFVGWDSNDFECMTEDKTFVAKYCLKSEYATVKFSRSKRTIMEGSTISIKPIVTAIDGSALSSDSYVLEWDSDNWSVASVDSSGNITALKAGTANITVTVSSTGESAKLAITVQADSSSKLVLSSNACIGIDSKGYLRITPAFDNKVSNITAQFTNDELSFVDSQNKALTDADLIGTGSKIQLKSNEKIIDSITAVMTGDMTGDGIINNRDVVMLNKYQVGKASAEEYQIIAMDVNGDGYVNNKDAAVIARYLVGKETIK